MLSVDDIAQVCHEANKVYCRAIGDNSQLPWSAASWHQRESAIAGVLFVQQNLDASPSAAHDNWLSHKQAAGWVYGVTKDENAKTHPCMVAYDKLPAEQQIKDALFRSIVLAFTKGE